MKIVLRLIAFASLISMWVIPEISFFRSPHFQPCLGDSRPHDVIVATLPQIHMDSYHSVPIDPDISNKILS